MSLFKDLLMIKNQQFKEDDNYLYFVPQNSDGIMTLFFNNDSETPETSNTATPVLEYSYNKKTWFSFDANNGCKMYSELPIYFKAGNTTTAWSNGIYAWEWNPSTKVKVYGDLRSVLGRGEIHMGWMLVNMFSSSNIIKCPDLYSPSLNQSGFYNSLCRDSSITEPPKIYATGNVSKQAFEHVFRATQLIHAADFTSINNNAVHEYAAAFRECKNLKEMAKTKEEFSNSDSILRETYLGCSSLIDTDRKITFSNGIGSYGMNLTLEGCSSIISTPTIKVKGNVDQYAFNKTFYNCSSLVESRIDLSGVTSMSSAGYNFYQMFSGCTKLKNAPITPTSALSASQYAFYGMFMNCGNLEEAPYFKFTTVSSYSAGNMFRNCVKIKTAPPLRPKTLVSNCYYYMFYGCSNLKSIYWYADTAPTSTYCNNWVYGVSPTGTFYRDIDATWTISYGNSNVPTGWKVKTMGALKFVSTGNATLALTNNTGKTINIEYSIDRNTWAPLTSTPVSYNGSIYVRGKNPGGLSLVGLTNAQQSKCIKFVMSGSNASVKGNIMSLIDYEMPPETIPSNSGFMKMFEGCTTLTNISGLELPFTDLNEDFQMWRMFYGTGITNLDNYEIEFNSVGVNGMYEMFASSKTSSTPKIHIYGSVGEEGMMDMFKNCSSLTKIQQLKVDGTLYRRALYDMFRNCTGITTLDGNIDFNFKDMRNEALAWMFERCTSLNDAKIDLSNCSVANKESKVFQYMFYGCTSLESMPIMPNCKIEASQYKSMFGNCSKLKYTTPIKGLLSDDSNQAFMNMFNTCPLIDEIHLEIEDNTSSAVDKKTIFTNWLTNVASEGTVHMPVNFVLQRDSSSGIPVGWNRSADIPGTMKIVLGETTDATQKRFSIYCSGDVLDEYVLEVNKENSYTFSDSDLQWASYNDVQGNNRQKFYSTTYEKGKTIYLRGYLKTDDINDSILETFYNEYGDYHSYDAIIKIFGYGAQLKCYSDIRNLVKDSKGNLPKIAPPYIFTETFQDDDVIKAPEIGFTSVDERSFESMFSRCKNLEKAPVLNFEMYYGCCNNMFYGCHKLNYIECSSSTLGKGLTENWVYGVSPTGTYYGPATEPVGTNGIPTKWVINGYIPADSFKITGAQSISLNNKNGNNPNIEYSIDKGKHWNVLSSLTNINGTVYLRGKNPTGINLNPGKYTTIQLTAADATKGCEVSGNIANLIDYETNDLSQLGSYCFCYLFYQQTDLKDVSNLIMTKKTTSSMCFFMFSGTSIESMPQLPAFELNERCYQFMFSECTKLKKLTHIPAYNFGTDACYGMFVSCTSLEDASVGQKTVVRFADTSCTYSEDAFFNMFNGCTNLKIVNYNKKPISIKMSSIPKGLYRYLFNNCSSLEYCPLVLGMNDIKCGDYAFDHTYSGTSVVNAKPFFGAYSVAAAATNAYAFYYMFSNCKKIVTGFIPPVTAEAASLFGYMYADSSIVFLTVKPAKITITRNILNYCCKGCTSIRKIDWSLAKPPSTTISSNWLSSASSKGTFSSSFKRAEIAQSTSGVPSAWTIITT